VTTPANHGLDVPRGASKSRKGSIPTNIDTLSESAKMSAFADELRKMADISDIDVQEAATKLQRPRPWRTIGQTATMAGAAAPVIDAGGKFTRGFVDAHGGLRARLAGGASAVGALTSGEVAAKALTTGLGGGVIAAAKEGIDLHRARKTVQGYLDQHADKLANMPGVTAPATGTGLAAPSPKVRSSTNKGQRVGVTPIAAKSGVTNSASGIAMNPRRSVGDAMTTFKA
jgi:hypothetical protein